MPEACYLKLFHGAEVWRIVLEPDFSGGSYPMDFPCYCSTTLVLESEMNVFFAFAIAQEWNNTRWMLRQLRPQLDTLTLNMNLMPMFFFKFFFQIPEHDRIMCRCWLILCWWRSWIQHNPSSPWMHGRRGWKPCLKLQAILCNFLLLGSLTSFMNPCFELGCIEIVELTERWTIVNHVTQQPGKPSALFLRQ